MLNFKIKQNDISITNIKIKNNLKTYIYLKEKKTLN